MKSIFKFTILLALLMTILGFLCIVFGDDFLDPRVASAGAAKEFVLQEIKEMRLPSGLNRYYNAFFLDKKTGWVVASDRVSRTTNGGETWKSVKIQDPAGVDPVSGLFFINSRMGWYSASHGLYQTIDGGENWIALLSPPIGQDLSEHFSQLHFLTPERGWGVGADDLYRTEDGGKAWVEQKWPVEAIGLNLGGLFILDDSHIWMTAVKLRSGKEGALGYILHSRDGGKSWNKTELELGTVGVTFLDSQTGWAGGSHMVFEDEGRMRHTAVFYRTTDGLTWKRISLPFDGKNARISGIYRRDKNEGWIAGHVLIEGKYALEILHTLDGGEIWKIILMDRKVGPGGVYLTEVEQHGKPVLLLVGFDATYLLPLK